ncbi:alpha/beta hydrolase [Burkholderia sp. SRS-46]|nr:alpha/beta hydrolase [Burkholderia sp. SRS-46]
MFIGLEARAGAAEPVSRPAVIERSDRTRIDYYLERRVSSAHDRILLVVIQGSDCNSVTRIQSIRRHLVNVLPGADVLTVEKYGLTADLPYSDDVDRPDCPREYVLHDSPTQRVRDLETVISRLNDVYGYKKIVALGGSEGAVIANLLASRSNLVSAAVAFNGGGRWFLDDVLHSISTSEMPPDEKASAIAGMRQLAAQIEMHPMPDLRMSDHGYAWWSEMLVLDQLAVLERVNTPTLIIQSGADKSASPDAAAALVAALKEMGRRNVDMRTYPTLDHRLRGYDGADEMERVVGDIAVWLRTHGFR